MFTPMEAEINDTGGVTFPNFSSSGFNFLENSSLLISPNCSAFLRNVSSSLNTTALTATALAAADCNLVPTTGSSDADLGHPATPYATATNNWWAHLLVQILYGIVCFVGLCGNTLVIYVVVRFSKMQTVTNLYIVNLAIADECFLVGIPFLMTTASLGYWPFGKIVCKAYFTSTSINQITSSMFLLIMSADRYLAVCHPISAPKYRTPFIAKIVALTAWTLSALIMVPIFMYANTLEVDEAINCNIFWPDTGGWTGETVFIVYSLIISFAVPLSLIMIFYVLVIRKLRTVGPKRPRGLPPPTPTPSTAATTNGNKMDTNGGANNQLLGAASGPGGQPNSNSNHVVAITPQQANRARDRKKSHRKVTKLVLTVITVYFLCWAPYWTMQLALIFTPQDQASKHSGIMLFLFLFCGCLSYSNSAMNPILYAFLSENFKKSFLKACTCARGQDVNAALHMENSVFPRGRKSEKGRKGMAVSATSGTGQSAAGPHGGVTGTATTGIAPSCNKHSNLLQVPPPQGVHSPVSDLDDSGEESDDEGAAILRSNKRFAAKSSNRSLNVSEHNALSTSSFLNSPPTSGASNENANTPNETFVKDGVHVTAL